MKKKFTVGESLAGELAVRSLSEKAQEFYHGSDPLTVYERTVHLQDENGEFLYDENDWAVEQKVYFTRGIVEADNITFDELQSLFEEYQDINDEVIEEEYE